MRQERLTRPPLRGLHVNNAADPALWRVLDSAGPGRVALVKVVNPDQAQLRRLKTDYGVRLTVGRFLLDGEGLAPTPQVAAERWYRALRERLMPLVPYLDYLEVPANEQYERPPDLARYADASARFVELAAADGLRVLVGGFARGTPEIEDFPQFLPALLAARAHGGGFHCHEYFHRGRLDLTWQVGRIKRFYDAIPAEARVPVIISEYGLDNGDLPRYSRRNAGWRDAGYGAAGDYAADLDAGHAYYEIACPEVVGTCLFNLGDYDATWASFSANDPVLARWAAGGPRPVEPAPPPAPPPPPPPVPPSEPGKKEMMKLLHPWPVEWSQLRDRAYDADGDQNATRNCNLACLTAFLHYAYGLNIPNDWLTQPLGLSYRGNTTIQQGVFLLRQFFGIECEVYGPGTASDALRPVVEKAIRRGYPAIVLCAGNGETLGVDTPHFLAAFGYDDQGVMLYDPWDGKARMWGWGEFEARQLFAQAYVPLRRRDAQLPPY